MLPSLSAGTFECDRPQIVFERSWCAIVIGAKLCVSRYVPGVRQEAAQPPMPSLIMDVVAVGVQSCPIWRNPGGLVRGFSGSGRGTSDGARETPSPMAR